MLDPAIDPAGLAGVAGPAAHTMVSWLGTYFVHSSLLIGGVWAFSRFLPLDALTRSLLWKMSLVGGLFTATLQTGLGVEPLFGRVTVASTAPAELAPTVAAPLPPVIEEEPPPLLVPFTRACVGCESHVVVISDDDVTAVITTPQVFVDSPVWFAAPAPSPMMASTPTPAPAQVATAGASGGVSAAVWAFAGLFLLGAGASLGRLGVSFGRLRRGLRGRRVLGTGPLRERLSRLLARVRVPDNSVLLSMSEKIGSPIAMAGREIVVPERARALAPRQQQAMLAHELAHVLRRDPAWQVLAAVVEAAMFFQPLNRVARRGMQEAAEELCDDWAVRQTGSEVHLARCLAEVAAWPGHGDMSAFASPMAGDGSQLVRRVERLLDGPPRERGLWARRWRGLLGAALLMLVALGAPGLSLVAEASEPPAAEEWPTSPDNGPGAPAPTLMHVPEMPLLAMHSHGREVIVVHQPPNHAVHGHDVVVVQQPQELTRRQKRLLRRAERHARKAAKLRGKAGLYNASTALYVPVTVATPPTPPTPPSPPSPPAPPAPPHFKVVVAHDHDDCDHDDDDHGPHVRVGSIAVPHVVARIPAFDEEAFEAQMEAHAAALEAQIEAMNLDDLDEQIERELAKVDFDKIAADVQRGVEGALRGAERAREQAERGRERAERDHARAERDRERAHRDAERAQRDAEKAQRHGEAQRRKADAVRRVVDEALRDGVIDAGEQRKISEAARKAHAK